MEKVEFSVNSSTCINCYIMQVEIICTFLLCIAVVMLWTELFRELNEMLYLNQSAIVTISSSYDKPVDVYVNYQRSEDCVQQNSALVKY